MVREQTEHLGLYRAANIFTASGSLRTRRGRWRHYGAFCVQLGSYRSLMPVFYRFADGCDYSLLSGLLDGGANESVAPAADAPEAQIESLRKLCSEHDHDGSRCLSDLLPQSLKVRRPAVPEPRRFRIDVHAEKHATAYSSDPGLDVFAVLYCVSHRISTAGALVAFVPSYPACGSSGANRFVTIDLRIRTQSTRYGTEAVSFLRARRWIEL